MVIPLLRRGNSMHVSDIQVSAVRLVNGCIALKVSYVIEE